MYPMKGAIVGQESYSIFYLYVSVDKTTRHSGMRRMIMITKENHSKGQMLEASSVREPGGHPTPSAIGTRREVVLMTAKKTAPERESATRIQPAPNNISSPPCAPNCPHIRSRSAPESAMVPYQELASLVRQSMETREPPGSFVSEAPA